MRGSRGEDSGVSVSHNHEMAFCWRANGGLTPLTKLSGYGHALSTGLTQETSRHDVRHQLKQTEIRYL